jgi:hypothetical protein
VDDWAVEAWEGLSLGTVCSHVALLRPVTALTGEDPAVRMAAHDVRYSLNKRTEERSSPPRQPVTPR